MATFTVNSSLRLYLEWTNTNNHNWKHGSYGHKAMVTKFEAMDCIGGAMIVSLFFLQLSEHVKSCKHSHHWPVFAFVQNRISLCACFVAFFFTPGETIACCHGDFVLLGIHSVKTTGQSLFLLGYLAIAVQQNALALLSLSCVHWGIKYPPFVGAFSRYVITSTVRLHLLNMPICLKFPSRAFVLLPKSVPTQTRRPEAPAAF